MIKLEKITDNNKDLILSLSTTDAQKSFVADNAQSLSEAAAALDANGHAFPFGIYDEDTPVGFLMIGFGTDDDWPDPPDIAKNNYNIWRLMIDEHHQHKGFGKAAMKLALDFIRSFPCGKADLCWVSYLPENTAAANLYRSFGFLPTNDFDHGEIIAVLKL